MDSYEELTARVFELAARGQRLAEAKKLREMAAVLTKRAEELEADEAAKLDMSLADQIVEACLGGRISQPFSTVDVREHFGDHYAETHIATVLPNYCEGGDQVLRRGVEPRFRRVGAGRYELFSK